MNKEKRKRQIRMFLDGKGGKDVDAFCIYQWIERCHFHSWWDYALRLAPSVPPNSLDQHYHKRLDFLLTECRNNLEQFKRESLEIKNDNGIPQFSIPLSFVRTCFELKLDFCGITAKGLSLELGSRRVVFVEGISPNKCVFRFYDMDSDDLASWLSSHGFGDLVQGIVRQKTQGQLPSARLRISWSDAANLIESLIVQMDSEDKASYHISPTATAAYTDSSYPSSTKKIEFPLNRAHTLREYGVITFPPEHRRFFPGYKVSFILQTDLEDIETRISSGSKYSRVGDPAEGKYISGGLKPWVRNHYNEIQDGAVIVIENIEPGRIYRLSLKKQA